MIVVSTQLIALWEALLLLQVPVGGGLMSSLLPSASSFFSSDSCGAVSLNVCDMLRRLPFEWPFDILQLLVSNWPAWMRYLTTLILSARENENQPHGDSESAWSEVMPPSPRVPLIPEAGRNQRGIRFGGILIWLSPTFSLGHVISSFCTAVAMTFTDVRAICGC